jgi:hypothetical protein
VEPMMTPAKAPARAKAADENKVASF